MTIQNMTASNMETLLQWHGAFLYAKESFEPNRQFTLSPHIDHIFFKIISYNATTGR